MIYLITGNNKLFQDDEIQSATMLNLLQYFENSDSIALDTETQGYDPHNHSILSMQLGDSENQFVIDTPTILNNEDNLLNLKQLLENKLILLHNAQFDLRFLMKLGIDCTNIYDTFLTECILTTGYDDASRKRAMYKAQPDKKYLINNAVASGEKEPSPLALNGVAFKYCGVYMSKSVRGEIHWRGLDTSVIKYGAKDVAYLHEIRDKQLQLIHKHGLNSVLELENRVVRVFAKMSLDGIKLDTTKWLQVADITEKATSDLEKELDNIVLSDKKLNKFKPVGIQQNLFGFEERKLDINWSSPAQKLDILNTLGLNVDSVGDRILQRNKNEHILISKLIEYAKMSKLASAFGRDFIKFVNSATGRVHSSFWQILSTGRISVSEPNLNQIPSKGNLAKSIRAAFIPENGYKIVGGDYSSFELAIIAEFSQDPLWVNTLKNGGNLHSELCAKTFNIPIENVNEAFPPKPSLKYRDVQKTVDFGLAYGMSYFKLSDTIQVSENEAKNIITQFFTVVPLVEKFLNKLGNFGKRNGFIVTPPPFKRIRWFPYWKGIYTDKQTLGEIERASKNTPIQGANGNVIKLALIKVQERIDRDNLPIRILLSIYDEIQTECREDLANWWKTELQTIMVDAAKECLKTVPIEVDVKINDYWTK